MNPIDISTPAPRDGVLARLQEGCRSRGWHLDLSMGGVSVAIRSKRAGTLARFTGHLTNDGAITRLAGEIRAPVAGFASAIALALGAMPLLILLPLASDRPGRELEIVDLTAIGCVALVPVLLAALFGWIAYQAPAALRQTLRAGLEEMVAGG